MPNPPFVTQRFRDQIQKVSQPLLEEFDQMVASIQTGFVRSVRVTGAHCVAYHSVGQSIPDNAFTPAIFNTVEDDPLGMLPPKTSIFTIPDNEDGLWHLTCTGIFLPNAVGQRVINCRINGNSTIPGGATIEGNPGGVFACTVHFNTYALLNAGVQVEFTFYQNSGGALQLGTTNTYCTRAALVRVA
jgi:hypothetical protein